MDDEVAKVGIIGLVGFYYKVGLGAWIYKGIILGSSFSCLISTLSLGGLILGSNIGLLIINGGAYLNIGLGLGNKLSLRGYIFKLVLLI